MSQEQQDFTKYIQLLLSFEITSCFTWRCPGIVGNLMAEEITRHYPGFNMSLFFLESNKDTIYDKLHNVTTVAHACCDK